MCERPLNNLTNLLVRKYRCNLCVYLIVPFPLKVVECVLRKEQRHSNSAACLHTFSQVLYAWAHDAPRFRLPDQVGFKVGAQTDIQYLVLQVHYSNVQRFKGERQRESPPLFLHKYRKTYENTKSLSKRWIFLFF